MGTGVHRPVAPPVALSSFFGTVTGHRRRRRTELGTRKAPSLFIQSAGIWHFLTSGILKRNSGQRDVRCTLIFYIMVSLIVDEACRRKCSFLILLIQQKQVDFASIWWRVWEMLYSNEQMKMLQRDVTAKEITKKNRLVILRAAKSVALKIMLIKG